MSKLVLAAVALAAVLGGCASRQDRAEEAFQRYQTASAGGDLIEARRALLSLVAADDSVTDYWIELGKVQLQLADYGGAFNAFSRANELDRGNVIVLSALTNLALRSGNMLLAEESARELELVAPDDPTVPLTYGYVALRHGKLDEANRHVERLLSVSPFDPSAKILKSRILLRSGKPDSAIDLLRKQVQLQPSDQGSLRALVGMYQLREQWSDAAWAARRLLIWQPKDQNTRAQLIESELRAGRTQVALADTAAGLAVANEHEIERLLEPWVIQKSESRAADTVANIARGASGQRRIAMARFLTLAHHPPEVLELMRVAATLPVKVPNATQNALYGAALAQTGQTAAAFERLDQVISLDSANADALRARAELRSRLGHHKAAIEDAQKLVASDRKSSSARLLMAQIQVAAGDPDGARRTLWDAFHDIPADRSIYGQLRRLVARLEGGQSVERLAQEFNDQRTEEITRGFA